MSTLGSFFVEIGNQQLAGLIVVLNPSQDHHRPLVRRVFGVVARQAVLTPHLVQRVCGADVEGEDKANATRERRGFRNDVTEPPDARWLRKLEPVTLRASE